MARQWCKTDPIVNIDGERYNIVLGVDSEARDGLESIRVLVSVPGTETGNHRLLGVPIDFEFGDASELWFSVYMTSGGDSFPCTIQVLKDREVILSGAGLTGLVVDALPVVSE